MNGQFFYPLADECSDAQNKNPPEHQIYSRNLDPESPELQKTAAVLPAGL